MSALAENSVQESRQFLTFLLNDQEYGWISPKSGRFVDMRQLRRFPTFPRMFAV
jgi:hypothetical protein